MLNPFHVHNYETKLDARGQDFRLLCRCGDECFSIAVALRAMEKSKNRADRRIVWTAVVLAVAVLGWVVMT